MRADGQVNVWEAGLEVAHGVERGVVVRIRADKESVVAVADGGDIVLDHAGDDFRFVP